MLSISQILNYIDNGHIALPEFQRGFVWRGDQVRHFFDSLYRRHPVGMLLVWVTETRTDIHRGGGNVSPGVVKLLLDGQQRVTSLYGVVRGQPPKFFDGDPKAFTGLQFNLESEEFSFYQPVNMKDKPLWIDVTELLSKGHEGHQEIINRLSKYPEIGTDAVQYSQKLSQLLGILDIELHDEEVTGQDKSLDVVVNIFNRVNSGGTKLSKGDLALAKICADWPDARNEMQSQLKKWQESNFEFSMDWLLRSINTVLTGEAKFHFLHDKSANQVQDGLHRAAKHIDKCLNYISGRLGLDHDRVFFARFAVPVMVRYLDQKSGKLTEVERDKLLFWYIQAGMWGRFSGSTESVIDKDMEALSEGGLDRLLEEMRLSHGGFKIEKGHFTGWSRGARFYPVLYWLTRVSEAKDWESGLPLKASMLGQMSSLEVHHIFPKSLLYKHGYSKAEVNALANFCFQTKESNLNIGNKLPEEYFPEIEERHPGVLASQWIPQDPRLWKVENYLEFIEERKRLLADEVNRQLKELLHGDTQWLEGASVEVGESEFLDGVLDLEEENELQELNMWMKDNGLTEGSLTYEENDPITGEKQFVLDLAWPHGVLENYTKPVSVVLNKSNETVAKASQAGYLCFTSSEEFKAYVQKDILKQSEVV